MRNVNVLSARMELGVLSKCHCALIVAVDHDRLGCSVRGIELD